MITPTIGRVVWVHRRVPNGHGQLVYPEQPEVGFVTYVTNDRLINVAGFDELGRHFVLHNLRLVQDGDDAYAHGNYAEWMPYQKGQAAKVDEILKAK